jgi:altronate hydrolase
MTIAKGITGPAIRLHPRDNVVVARMNLEAGTALSAENVVVRDPVPAGYKIAAADLLPGEAIRKYNTVIGFAATAIAAGSLLHKHNIEYRALDSEYAYASDYRPFELIPAEQQAIFQGIVRDDGRVGTRNYIGIVSGVHCSATVVNHIAAWFTKERMAAYPNVDGVVPFSHVLGCGMEGSGDAIPLLRRTLAGYARHPNIAAALLVGLGCERNQIHDLLSIEKLHAGPRLRSFVIQETGGTQETIEAGIAAVCEMLPDANRVRRQAVSASHITLGLQCGGSDGFSSITANPAVGTAVDILIRNGGTAILAKTPAIYGAQHTLTRRAVNREVGEKLIQRIQWWKQEYAAGRDTQINGRLAPGNDAGGLSNICEKALGTVLEGGTGPLMAVYEYAQPVEAKGLVFMDTPGYDPVSVTGQIAGGANLIVFTTGRGSCFGAKPAPSLKLASNTPTFRCLEGDMDINCGEILDGTCSLEDMGQGIFDHLLRTASGERTKSERLGVGDYEFIPWQIGIVG